jgi:phosphatidate cytidylyltransferase
MAAAIVAAVGVAGLLIAGGAWVFLRRRPDGIGGRLVIERAVSYSVLAAVLAVAMLLGLIGITALLATIAAIALLEWCRLADLPARHVLALEISSLAIMLGTALRGTEVADLLVGGLVLAGVLLPVVRPDTTRAIRDFGIAAVGLIVTSVMLAHGVALVAERGTIGVVLVGAVALGCAGSDVGAFVVGKRFGSRSLATTLSPNKTREGLLGNLLGALVGIALLAPVLLPIGGAILVVGLVLTVAVGSVWGDLLESAAKREFGVKDAGGWLPGFGGILDRIDSLLLALPLTYWAARLHDVVTGGG